MSNNNSMNGEIRQSIDNEDYYINIRTTADQVICDDGASVKDKLDQVVEMINNISNNPDIVDKKIKAACQELFTKIMGVKDQSSLNMAYDTVKEISEYVVDNEDLMDEIGKGIERIKDELSELTEMANHENIETLNKLSTGSNGKLLFNGKEVSDTNASSTALWGKITGNLNDQTDLKAALDKKANKEDIVDSHSNRDVLDKLSANHSGKLMYDGEVVNDDCCCCCHSGSGSSGGDSGPTEWGTIIGVLNNQTDLKAALDKKDNLHDNREVLNKLSDSNGKLFYNGNKVCEGGNNKPTEWGKIIGVLNNQTDLKAALDKKDNLHDNREVLNKLSDSNGKLFYNGNKVCEGGGSSSNSVQNNNEDNKSYRILLSGSADDQTKSDKINKNGGLRYNPKLGSLASGLKTIASGEGSHAEGAYATILDSKDGNTKIIYYNNMASGKGSHAEGIATTASGEGSHAEGYYTTAYGNYSHAEGYGTKASSCGHTEGCATTAFGIYSHAEGYHTCAYGKCSHAEGYTTTSSGDNSHAEGNNTKAIGKRSHVEGEITTAYGSNSHAEGKNTFAHGDCSHAEGSGTTAFDNYSHTEGYQTYASGDCSHAEGYQTCSYGDTYFGSHAEGRCTYAYNQGAHAEGITTCSCNDGTHAEGSNTTAYGDNSHAEGCNTYASDHSAHAEGYGTTASGESSHAEGEKTSASGYYSHAEGWFTYASGNDSHTEGNSTTASGWHSHAEGSYTYAFGNCSHAEGFKTCALNDSSHVCGRYNATMIAGGNDTNMGTAFVIGNGTETADYDHIVTRSNAFSVQFNGTVAAMSTITASTTADYAEFFEWKDGNPNNEDRVGHFVTLDNDKILIATDPDQYILGIVSGRPFVLGNGDCDVWNGMYLTDDYNRYITEPAPKMELDKETGEYKQVLDEDGNIVYEGTRFKLNPDYDPSKPYVKRSDRKEWAAIGMLGVLSVDQDGTCEVNGYACCNKDGIATKCNRTDPGAYRVIAKISDSIIKVILK